MIFLSGIGGNGPDHLRCDALTRVNEYYRDVTTATAPYLTLLARCELTPESSARIPLCRLCMPPRGYLEIVRLEQPVVEIRKPPVAVSRL